METTDVEQRVVTAAARRAGVDPGTITGDSLFRDDLSFDSLDELEFVIAMEGEFGIEISHQEAETVKTIGQAVELIHRKVTSQERLVTPMTGHPQPVECTNCHWRGQRINARPKRCPACGGMVNYR